MSAIEKRNPTQEAIDQIRSDDFQGQLEVALPEGVTPDRFVRVTATALMEKPELVKADRATLFTAVIKAAQAGLLPNGDEAALVEFGGKVQFMPMVGGFKKIAAEHGWTLRGQPVYANDEFSYSDEPQNVWHKKALADRGDLVAAYAIAEHRDGRRLQLVMGPDEILKRKAIARTKNVWDKWPGQMWEKTVVRDLFDDLPLDPADKRIAAVLDTSTVEPREATRVLYGAPRAALAAAPDQDPPTTERPSEDSQQAAEEEATGPSAASTGTSSAAPGDEEPEPVFTDENDAQTFTSAAMTPFPNGQYEGKTLAEIADLGEKGAVYLWWALRQKQYAGDFRTALEAFVREAGIVHSTEGELWARYERWQAENGKAAA